MAKLKDVKNQLFIGGASAPPPPKGTRPIDHQHKAEAKGHTTGANKSKRNNTPRGRPRPPPPRAMDMRGAAAGGAGDRGAGGRKAAAQGGRGGQGPPDRTSGHDRPSKRTRPTKQTDTTRTNWVRARRAPEGGGNRTTEPERRGRPRRPTTGRAHKSIHFNPVGVLGFSSSKLV